MDDIDQLYDDILEQLQTGKRPRIPLGEKRRQQIAERWREVLDDKRERRELLPVLCILEYAYSPNGDFHEFIVETLEKEGENREDLLIHTLGVSRQHVVNYSQLHGEPLPGGYIEALKKLLREQQDPEVLEWVLRLIESTGNQSLKFRGQVLEQKPGLLTLFNKHKKASRQIIQLLEKRWANYGF